MGVDGAAALFAALGNFGPLGVLVGYLIWRDNCDRKERREQADARAKIQERDIDAREKLATAMAGLMMVVQGRPSV